MNKPQPFSSIFAEALEAEALHTLSINRNIELKRCVEALFERSENILIHGSRGVGKTFLVLMLLKEIKSRFKDTVSLFLNMESLFVHNPSEAMPFFPKAVLLQLCRTVWVDVLEKEYSALREILSQIGSEIKFRKKGEKKIANIYRLLMTSTRKMIASREHSYGASAILKGNIKEGVQREWFEFDILPFEFFEFVREIKKESLLPYRKERIIVICDEANKLPLFQQAAILERYLELFATRRIQFVFVISYSPGEKIGKIPAGFQNIFELEGFQEKRYVRELINKHATRTKVSFLNSAIDVVWDIFKGHPYHTIRASFYAYEQACRDRLDKVDDRIMSVACAQLLREEEKYGRLLKKSRR